MKLPWHTCSNFAKVYKGIAEIEPVPSEYASKLKELNTMNKIIYHANCSDGFCAAYLFWKQAQKTLNPMAYEYIPFNYSQELDLDKFNKDDDVYIVDFSFDRQTMIELAKRVARCWVLDHHKTAEAEFVPGADLPDTLFLCFDMERSGAQLAYDFLETSGTMGLEYSGNFIILPPSQMYPSLVAYVADRDLWKFELPNSKEVNMYLRSLKFDFLDWRRAEHKLANFSDDIVNGGEAILQYQQREIENAVRVARDVEFTVPNMGTYIVPAVNTTVNFSEVAGELAEGRSFGIGWFQRADGKFQYSLRSRDEGIDVSEVAKNMGGGGHAQAAGFESDHQVLITRIQDEVR